MINYMRADLYRVNRRVPRLVWLLICFGIAAVTLLISLNHVVWNSVNYTASVTSMLELMSLILGFFEMIYIFSDDFKAKSMQVAIGGGVTRLQVVLTKFFEVVLLVFVDMLILFVCSLLFGAVSEIHFLGEQIWELFAILISEVLKIAMYVSLTMIVLFYFQSAGVSVVLYAFAALDPISLLLQVLQTKYTLITDLHLISYTYTSVSGLFQTQLVFGKLSISSLLLMLVYIGAATAVTVVLFNKRELEF